MKTLNPNEKHYSDTANDLWNRISDYYIEKEYWHPEETEYDKSIKESLLETFDAMALNVCQSIDKPIKIIIAAVFSAFRKHLANELLHYDWKWEATKAMITSYRKDCSSETAEILDAVIGYMEKDE